MEVFADGIAINKGNYTEITEAKDIVVLIPEAEKEFAKKNRVIGIELMEKMTLEEKDVTRFESHNNYDCMCIMIPDFKDANKQSCRILIYLEKNCLTMIYEPSTTVDRLIEHMKDVKCKASDITGIFFSYLMGKDVNLLEEIEEGIAIVEEQLASDNIQDIPGKIAKLRKKLLQLKKYYDPLFNLLEDIEENENGLIDDKQLKMIHIQTNKAERLSQTIQSLRDYVMQVRELYQSQLDIQLNSIMKFFTLITAIFLPLTLIVGWYGMNLKMPEVIFPLTYLIVIIISIAIVIGSLVYFRYKKWL